MNLTQSQIEDISSEFARIVDGVAIDHFPALTQEHQLTARIGQALESGLNGRNFGGAAVSVITQDVPDKGRGSLEKPLGSDVYIGVSLEGEFDKGFLVQGKWDRNQRGLVEQCETMLSHTPESYVWEYGPSGVRVKQARSVVNASRYIQGDRTWSNNVRRLFERVLRCRAGDKRIGVPPGPSRRTDLRRMLEDFAVSSAVSIEIDRED